jgi:diguanylate cyclase
MISNQLFDLLDIGIVILDKELNVYKWNKWMELHSNIPANQIIGHSIFDFFPNLNNESFSRSLKYVLNFGNYYFFSQKLHHYLFPFKPVSSLAVDIEYMQQSCNMGQLVDEKSSTRYIYITVHDVTEIAVYEKNLIEMNTKDSLTGVYNRKFLENQLRNELKRFNRGLRPFGLIMLDIDFFKKINDTHGHLCGDYILKSLASSIVSSIRSTDIFARYGGEEFFCLLTETNIDSAAYLAENLRKVIENKAFTFQGTPIQITISLGVTAMRPEIQTSEVLLKRADDALYEAKRTGRNKVIVLP